MAYGDLVNLVRGSSAFRRKRRLQPAGGVSDKLFPPTYPGESKGSPPRHVFERRRIEGRDVWCVLIDSVQSQANRLEESLLRAAEENRITLPRLVVDFAPSGLNSIGTISSLEAPHRIFDAILRDSMLNGTALSKTDLGDSLRRATPRDASAIFEVSPSALLFGAWNSTSGGGGVGARFARAIVSEIIGVDVPVEELAPDRRTGEIDVRTAGRRTGSRIDPLGILRSVEVFKGDAGWDVTKEAAGNGATPVRPSEINHGNIVPSVTPLGVTCSYAEQTAVITLAGLRRLRFGGSAARDDAARALIAALGLLALIEQDAQGYALRSRCDLVCDGPAPLEIVDFDGSTKTLELSRDEAVALYAEAFEAARAAGFALVSEPVRLLPQDRLVHIVRESMNRALADEAEDDDADG
jgi:CRISPR-associated protein Csb1